MVEEWVSSLMLSGIVAAAVWGVVGRGPLARELRGLFWERYRRDRLFGDIPRAPLRPALAPAARSVPDGPEPSRGGNTPPRGVPTLANRTAFMPRPPSRLWGLWCVSEERPEGYWLSHTHAQDEEDAPMTFLSRDDALAVARKERAKDGWFAEARAELLGCERETPPSITVALIGVAPPD